MYPDIPLLSILIPTRNRASYLRYAIQSALNVASVNIEIIVSENYGADDGWNIANSFTDSRLTVVRPDKPLPMHENWEFLLRKARGRWITFIGDDDAVMPHCADYLLYLESSYPEAEAIVSPRAYYFWEHAYASNDKPKCSFSFAHSEVWQDSKRSLNLCLNDKKEYIYLPQIYSGCFQRRSLVRRVIRLQGGHYFRSVTPDAYSAVVATLHTYRYLEVGIPMSWVGTSPSTLVIPGTKDRSQDFLGMHSDGFSMHPALGDKSKSWPFLVHFFEAYLAAAPFIRLDQLSWAKVRKIYRLAAERLVMRGEVEASNSLALSLGVEPLDPESVIMKNRLYSKLINRLRRMVTCTSALLSVFNNLKSLKARSKSTQFSFSYQASGDHCPNILSSDSVLARVFGEYVSKHLNLNDRDQ